MQINHSISVFHLGDIGVPLISKGEIMQTIFKYNVEVTDKQKVMMPKGAKVLHVHQQLGVPCIWAQVDTSQPLVERNFETFGTGHEMPTFITLDFAYVYVGTYHLQNGSLVFHIFEKL
jgi:hypothetical protein